MKDPAENVEVNLQRIIIYGRNTKFMNDEKLYHKKLNGYIF